MGHQRGYRAAVAGKHRGNNFNETTVNEALGHRTVVRRLLIAAAVLFVASVSGSAGHAQSGTFAGLGGSWHGGGTVSLDDCRIYVSAEPCAYCCYAIRESRFGRG